MVGRRTVSDDPLSPLVKDVAPHVVLAWQGELTDLQGAGVHDVGPTVSLAAVGSPRGLERGARGDPFEHVEQSAVVPFERAAGMVGIIGGPAVHQMDDLIGLVVSVGVFEEEQARLIDDQHTAVEEFKARRAMEFVVEDFRHVSFSVVVGIFEDHELVTRSRVPWFPLRVGGHASQPGTASVVEIQLDGFGDVRELGLIGEEFDFETWGDLRLSDEFIGAQVAKFFGFGVLLPWVSESGLRNE